MPVHTRPDHFGVKMLSNGRLLTAINRFGNKLADDDCKAAALSIADPREGRHAHRVHMALVKTTAM